MDHIQSRTPGEYAAEYNWATTAHDPPSIDLMTRVAQGLQALDAESSRRQGDTSPVAGSHDRRGQ